MPRTAAALSGPRKEPLNFRCTTALRRKLEAAAAANGHSLLREVETLVERGLDQDVILGGDLALRRIGYAMTTAFTIGGQYSAGHEVAFADWPGVARLSAIANVVVSLTKLCQLDDAAAELLLVRLDGAIKSLIVQRRAEQEGAL